MQIYRKIQYGDLIDIFMLDTRLEGRSLQGGSASDPNRSLLGATQFDWLVNGLKSSTTQWKILGQQVMMAPLELAFIGPLNDDQWDGYDYERTRLHDSININGISNLVVLTGDIHTSWVNDIPLGNYNVNNCTGSIGVEFIVTSVTSPGLSFLGGTSTSAIALFNPHIQYTNLSEHGYMILDVNKTRITGNYYYMIDISTVLSGEYFDDAYYMLDGEHCADQASGQSIRNTPPPAFAPEYPIDAALTIDTQLDEFVVFGAYPNPFSKDVTIQMYIDKETDLAIKIYNIVGELVFNDEIIGLEKGLAYTKLYLEKLQSGTYSLVIIGDNHSSSRTLIKYR